MVTTVKVLKRKDGASLVVGIVVALIISQLLAGTLVYISSWVSGMGYGNGGSAFPGSGFKGEYLQPIVYAVVQLVVLEILVWLYTTVKGSRSSK